MKLTLNLLVKLSLPVMVIGGSALSGCGGSGGGGGGVSQAQLLSGLIHWWKFDGNANDSVGTLSTTPLGPVSYASAPTGQGIVFNGTTTAVSLPATGDVQFAGSYSISAWANLQAYTTTSIWSTIIFDGDERNGLDPYFIQVDPNGTLVFQTRGTTQSYGLQGSQAFPLNKWVHVTGTYDKKAGIERLYVNGVLDAEGLNIFDLTPVVALDPTAAPGLGIGINNDFPNSGFDMGWDGEISDVRMYNRALSATEVTALYNQGARNLTPTARAR